MPTPKRREKVCDCAWLTHPKTGRRISQVKFCNKHRPTPRSASGQLKEVYRG